MPLEFFVNVSLLLFGRARRGDDLQLAAVVLGGERLGTAIQAHLDAARDQIGLGHAAAALGPVDQRTDAGRDLVEVFVRFLLVFQAMA